MGNEHLDTTRPVHYPIMQPLHPSLLSEHPTPTTIIFSTFFSSLPPNNQHFFDTVPGYNPSQTHKTPFPFLSFFLEPRPVPACLLVINFYCNFCTVFSPPPPCGGEGKRRPTVPHHHSLHLRKDNRFESCVGPTGSLVTGICSHGGLPRAQVK
jgi:hypothetical protein